MFDEKPTMARPEEQRRGWTLEEDQKLFECKSRYTHLSWPHIAMQARLERSGKSCRERWNNHLNPDVKRGNFSQEEDDTIIRLQWVYGNSWASIASHLQGRTDNAIKNRWNNHLKKRLEIMSDLERHLLYLELHLLSDDDASDHSARGDALESLMTGLASVIPNVDPNASLDS